ncbi:hypothetical protein J4714_14040, partial [Staphylococcus epidermidis]|nr:hypothetical protein [Staphylococcus epidermidis]
NHFSKKQAVIHCHASICVFEKALEGVSLTSWRWPTPELLLQPSKQPDLERQWTPILGRL